MNGIAKYVASTTLEDPEWQNTEVIEGDVPEAVAKLKEQPGKGLIVYGSGDLMNSLMAHDLIDEYRLWVHPVVLGTGSSFFEDGTERMDLELVDVDRDPVRGCHSHVPAAAVITSAAFIEQPKLAGSPRGIDPGAAVELAEDVSHVHVDRPRAHIELPGDLLVRAA